MELQRTAYYIFTYIKNVRGAVLCQVRISKTDSFTDGMMKMWQNKKASCQVNRSISWLDLGLGRCSSVRLVWWCTNGNMQWGLFFFLDEIQYWAKGIHPVVSNQRGKWDWSYWWPPVHTGGTLRTHKAHWSRHLDGCPLHEFWIKLALDEFGMWYLCSKAIGIQ